MTKVKLIINFDICDQPNDCWKVVSFNDRHVGYEPPYDYFTGRDKNGTLIPASAKFEKKLKDGTAFVLSCYQHSGIQWGLQGEVHQCRFDTSSVAGVLLWVDETEDLTGDYQRRQEWARNFLKEYTEWCNGQVFCFRIEDEDGDMIDSCGGYVGSDGLGDAIKEGLPEGCEIVEIAGDAKDLVEHLDLGVQIPV